ncbi:RPM1-interacting protein 4-like isoform X1 [Primulina tabacum]|uniref:RPM1-interacting protein 4-like isoform X1 n=1 Tax=Primulina tabacum TaxID=48773 RepID=UPI003F5A0669
MIAENLIVRSNVPKFGNWEGEDNVPYTVYFDKARKTRGGKMINPNEPQENPEMFENVNSSPLAPANAPVSPSRPRTRPEEPIVKGAGEDIGFRQSGNPPAQNENTSQKAASESNYGARRPKATRSPRPSAGSEQSFERSPLHHHQQAKVGGRVGEGKNYEGSQGTTGKSRMRQANLGDDSPDKAAAVPKFGNWETDPQSAENFTDIFQKVREERNAGPGNVSTTPRHSSYPTRSQPSNQPKKCCCPWW